MRKESLSKPHFAYFLQFFSMSFVFNPQFVAYSLQFFSMNFVFSPQFVLSYLCSLRARGYFSMMLPNLNSKLTVQPFPLQVLLANISLLGTIELFGSKILEIQPIQFQSWNLNSLNWTVAKFKQIFHMYLGTSCSLLTLKNPSLTENRGWVSGSPCMKQYPKLTYDITWHT